MLSWLKLSSLDYVTYETKMSSLCIQNLLTSQQNGSQTHTCTYIPRVITCSEIPTLANLSKVSDYRMKGYCSMLPQTGTLFELLGISLESLHHGEHDCLAFISKLLTFWNPTREKSKLFSHVTNWFDAYASLSKFLQILIGSVFVIVKLNRVIAEES